MAKLLDQAHCILYTALKNLTSSLCLEIEIAMLGSFSPLSCQLGRDPTDPFFPAQDNWSGSYRNGGLTGQRIVNARARQLDSRFSPADSHPVIRWQGSRRNTKGFLGKLDQIKHQRPSP